MVAENAAGSDFAYLLRFIEQGYSFIWSKSQLVEHSIAPSPLPNLAPISSLMVTLLVLVFLPTDFTITCQLNGV